ncbi:type I-B CRISPR-associated protein Cas7/Csh2 [Methanoregula sp.]|jgi:CRISPR-associated protein Csh2|uniref:type I-B CRISPR-associated protein Cas7/Csh2 n=1 Tax=Methanoregula sp. TaxID=2052170 RepID=UPI0026079699|nr:type I-B CRISPR-associated protein Cas7/Csh2 [Methanoregula sp.]MDD5142071.1 type I-B CRISPR-associated protein Cas7/Csh2 [Methanoregula sp.]
MSETVSKRSELLFLYDVKDINPNGDPLDENKPRIDEETMENLVSDVRLKRTVRDYLHDCKGMDIFIRGYRDDDGLLKGKKTVLDENKISNADDLIKKYIDMRLFGATAAISKKGAKGSKKSEKEEGDGEQKNEKNIILTGPVQFRIGRSLHRVKLSFIKGTTVMPSQEKGKAQGTFTEQYVLPYSLIGFYGIVNENAAKTTKLTDDDVKCLVDGLWNGTKNLISRSKVGQMPRLLINVIYKEKNFHIGDLNALIKKGKTDVSDEEIRDITQIPLEISALIDTLSANAAKIDHIDYCIDPHVRVTVNEKSINLEEALKSAKCPVKQLTL